MNDGSSEAIVIVRRKINMTVLGDIYHEKQLFKKNVI